jgi:NTE family protein
VSRRLGLVLSGGGARAAYQAGALRAISEIAAGPRLPFPILTGVSAGAINAAYLACHADDFPEATTKLWRMWEGLSEKRVFRVNRRVATLISSRWIADVVFRCLPLISGPKPEYLLDTRPLLSLLRLNLDFNATKKHIRAGHLHGVAFSATNYDTGTAVTFFDGHPSIQPWLRRTRIGIREDLSADQVVASAALPLFFPPVMIRGSYYGDGCIRLTTPMSPALHLGADRILGIGTRSEQTPKVALAVAKGEISPVPSIKPSLADVFGVMLSAVFLDSLELDFERLQRINEGVQLTNRSMRKARSEKLRHVSALLLQPVRDLGGIAKDVKPPLPFRHLLYAMGAASDRSTDILSFLAFEKTYTSKLLELGYHDAMARRNELREFLRAS